MYHDLLCVLLVVADRSVVKQLKAEIGRFAPSSIYVVAQNEAEFTQRINWLEYHLIVCDEQLTDSLAAKAQIMARIKKPHLPLFLLTNYVSADCPLPKPKACLLRDNPRQWRVSLESAYSRQAALVEAERHFHLKARRRTLLLQKYESLLENAPLPATHEVLAGLSRSLFGARAASKNAFPYYY